MTEVYCVVGLGKTGRSCIHYLQSQGARVYAVDSRPIPPEIEAVRAQFPTLDIQCGPLTPEHFSKATVLVVSPGLKLDDPAIEAARLRGVPIVGDIALFGRAARAPIVAITGTNGKTTVTTWMSDFARAAGWNVRVGGNIGTPALDLLSDTEPDLYVLELSSYQLDTLDKLPLKAATVLNVTPDHLDRYGSLEAYTASKQQIYRHCQNAIYNRADLRTLPVDFSGTVHSFGLDAPAAGDMGIRRIEGIDYFAYGEELLFPLATLSLAAPHHWANALVVLALAQALGIPRLHWEQAVAGLKGLAHRCQHVGSLGGIHFVNDSKGTNSGACLTAVNSLGKNLADGAKIILLLGGVSKEPDFSHMRPALAAYVRAAIIFGRDAAQLAQQLAGSVPMVQVGGIPEAIDAALLQAQPGDMVLLSPACASLDQYKDYQERGQHFEACVQRHIESA